MYAVAFRINNLKKTIFILGSNSFSGSHYINYLLDKKHNVVGISRSSELSEIFLPYKLNKNIGLFNFYKLDINKTKDLKKKRTTFTTSGTVITNWAQQTIAGFVVQRNGLSVIIVESTRRARGTRGCASYGRNRTLQARVARSLFHFTLRSTHGALGTTVRHSSQQRLITTTFTSFTGCFCTRRRKTNGTFVATVRRRCFFILKLALGACPTRGRGTVCNETQSTRFATVPIGGDCVLVLAVVTGLARSR